MKTKQIIGELTGEKPVLGVFVTLEDWSARMTLNGAIDSIEMWLEENPNQRPPQDMLDAASRALQAMQNADNLLWLEREVIKIVLRKLEMRS